MVGAKRGLRGAECISSPGLKAKEGDGEKGWEENGLDGCGKEAMVEDWDWTRFGWLETGMKGGREGQRGQGPG